LRQKTKRLSEKTQFRSGLKYCAGSAKEIVCERERERALVPRVPPPNAGASSLTLLISIFHQVLWHISNFHLGKIITQQQQRAAQKIKSTSRHARSLLCAGIGASG